MTTVAASDSPTVPPPEPPGGAPAPPTPIGHGRRSSERWLIGLTFAALLAAVGTALFLSYPSHSPEPTFVSPHENVRWHLARAWVEEGEPTYRLPAFDRLPDDIAPALTPRDAAALDEEVVPKDFPYAVAAVALLAAVAPSAPTYLTLLSSLGVLVLVALLTLELTGSRRATLLASAFVAASAPFWAASAGLLETGGTTTVFLLGGLVALCRSRRVSPRPSAPILRIVAGASFGMAVGFHHASAILVAGAVLSFSWARFGGSLRHGLVVAASSATALLPLAAYNTWLFGSPFATGYGAGADFLDDTVQGSSGGLVNLRVGLLGTQLWRYLGRPEILLLVVAAVLGWLYLRRSSPESFVRPLGLSLLLGGVPYLVFTGARPLWGSGNDYQANASFLRYSLPLIAVTSALAAGWVIAALSRRRWVAGVLAAVVLVGAFATTTRSPTNPVSYRRSVALDDQRQEQLLEIVPPDALVVTFKNDKLLWPQRSTLTAAYLAERQSAEITHVYDATPGPERLADVLLRLVELGEDVWLYDDSAWLGANPDMFPAFDLLLLEQGVQRLPTGVEALYRIQPPPSAG